MECELRFGRAPALVIYRLGADSVTLEQNEQKGDPPLPSSGRVYFSHNHALFPEDRLPADTGGSAHPIPALAPKASALAMTLAQQPLLLAAHDIDVGMSKVPAGAAAQSAAHRTAAPSPQAQSGGESSRSHAQLEHEAGQVTISEGLSEPPQTAIQLEMPLQQSVAETEEVLELASQQILSGSEGLSQLATHVTMPLMQLTFEAADALPQLSAQVADPFV